MPSDELNEQPIETLSPYNLLPAHKKAQLVTVNDSNMYVSANFMMFKDRLRLVNSEGAECVIHRALLANYYDYIHVENKQ